MSIYHVLTIILMTLMMILYLSNLYIHQYIQYLHFFILSIKNSHIFILIIFCFLMIESLIILINLLSSFFFSAGRVFYINQ
jgi:hypothetical protein